MPNILDDIRGSKRTSTVPSILPVPETANGMSLVRTLPPALAEETLRTATRLRMAMTQEERSLGLTGLADTDLAPDLAQGVALAFSHFEPGQVILVSAGPTADTRTGPGLAEILNGECNLHSALGEPQNGGPWVLSSGNMPANRSQLFFAPACEVLFAALRQKFKYVVVDCGPLPSPGSLVMIGRCDTVAVALAAGSRSKSEVKQMQGELTRVKARTLGVVLTRTRR